MPPAAPIVIMGGGISGLSAAYYLYQMAGKRLAAESRKIILLEGSDRLGGWIRTTRSPRGSIHEAGPNSMRCGPAAGDAALNTLQMVDYLGLSKAVLPGNREMAGNRRILAGGQMVTLPTSLGGLFRKAKPFNKRLFFLFLMEGSKGPLDLEAVGAARAGLDHNPHPGDISLYDLFSHRLGPEVATYYLDPFCRGVYAADPRRLSAAGCFPNLFRLEQEGYTFLRALMKLREKKSGHDFSDSDLARASLTQRWTTWTLDGGLERLPDRLRDFLFHMTGGLVELYSQSSVRNLRWDPDRNLFKLQVDTHEIENEEAKLNSSQSESEIHLDASHVFSALPAHSLSNILSTCGRLSPLVDAFREIDSVDVAVVNIEFEGDRLIPSHMDGFGYLVASRERSERTLGTIFNSSVFPQQEQNGDRPPVTRLTVMLGGDWMDHYFGSMNTARPEQFEDAALDSVRRHLKITAEPSYMSVHLNRQCIPQYRLGHPSRAAAIQSVLTGGGGGENRTSPLPLSLIGASFGSQGVNDCIFNARLAVEEFLGENTLDGGGGGPSPPPPSLSNPNKKSLQF